MWHSPVKTEKQLAKRDAKRDLGAELLQSVREMKTHKGKVVTKAEAPAFTRARKKARPESTQ